MLRTFHLEGELAQLFGREWKLNARSPAMALRLIEANTRQLIRYLQKSAEKGQEFVFMVGDKSLKADQLFDPVGRNEIVTITPLMQGAQGNQARNKNIFSVVAGVVLIVAATWMSGGALTGAALKGAFVSKGFTQFMAYMGLSMVMGGVAGLIAGTPSFGDMSGEPIERRPSYEFQGSMNRSEQGNAIPIIFGHCMIGSQVVSAGVSNENYVPSQTSVGTPSGGGELPPNYGAGFEGHGGDLYFHWNVGQFGSWRPDPLIPRPDMPSST